MRHQHTQTAEAEPETIDNNIDQRAAADVAEADSLRKAENALTKFDPDTLKAITTSNVMGSGMTAFLPQSMAEAMEFAKLMAASNSVPPHLRGKPGDCLAIILQSIRWRADPFAVAGKSYFVNNRMAFEAQLVNAVLNTSTVLDGRLQITWQGKGPVLQCTVRGRIRGDDEEHELIQESSSITTKNSPLWKQSERVQLGYYTSRAWGRLFTPEVMLGIYTPDEIEDGRYVPDGAPAQVVIPPRPTRESVRAETAAADRQRKEQVANEAHQRSIMRETPAHDAGTGEIQDDAEEEPEAGQGGDDAGQAVQGASADEGQASPATASAARQSDADLNALATVIIGKVKTISTAKGLQNLVQGVYAQDLETLRIDAPELSAKVQAEITAKKAWFQR